MAPEALGRKPLVLVVDDEPGVREALRMVLLRDYEVATASTGVEGLEILRQGGVSVILLDLHMPGWGGVETLLQMREADPNVGVVIVSGFGSKSEAEKVIRLEAYDLVTKPFAVAEISEAVARAAARAEEDSRRSRPRRRKVSARLRELCEEGTPLAQPRRIAGCEGTIRSRTQKPTVEEGELALLWAIFDDGIQTYCREVLRGTTSSLDYREAERWIFRSRASAFTSFASLCELFSIDVGALRHALEELRDRPNEEMVKRLIRHSA